MTELLEVQVRHKQGEFTINAAFSVEATGITALFGASGAGKTSILNMVAGLSRPNEGRILMNGECLFDAAKGIDVPPEKRRVGYVFQEARLFPHLSVRANLIYGMRLLKKSERYVHFDQVVELLGIQQILDRRPAKLSGGEKQRVAIGRALLCSPVLLLMDEPLASLDSGRRSEVLPFIRQLCSNFATPILYVSHLIGEIACLADYMVHLKNGLVVASGQFEEFKASMDLQRLLQENCCGDSIQSTLHES